MPMAPVPATVKTPFEYDVPLAVFSDPDGGPLTLSAFLADGKPLPSWLSFDSKQWSFSGTPPKQDQLHIFVKALDPQGSLPAGGEGASIQTQPGSSGAQPFAARLVKLVSCDQLHVAGFTR
ncbi:unnamed protein product [Effrenium voratum]|uniref:Dystroglycan-type cadherin-like domain-containing protein n=1 Tax=Effrenium voratum TaxID=2562239 RepID=A0AA36MGY7_9DINO|nr:unnamed protein product [Effrenium voratum]